MAIKNAELGGTDWVDGNKLLAVDLNDTFNETLDQAMPIGSIVSWLKTTWVADSGTTSATTANKLVEAGQNFETTVKVNMQVKNTTDNTWAYVTAVDSDTTLSLSADIMASGEDYTIYSTPALHSNWMECDGTTISDADSPLDGVTVPDLNGDGRSIVGSDTSAGTNVTETFLPSHAHNLGTQYGPGESGATSVDTTNGTDNSKSGWVKTYTEGTAMQWYKVVFIMKFK